MIKKKRAILTHCDNSHRIARPVNNPYRRTLVKLLCRAMRENELFHERGATRNAFCSGERHTCHARLLAFVSGLTNGPPHMARRARLRPDFGPAASPPLPAPRRLADSHAAPSMHHAESARASVNKALAMIFLLLANKKSPQ